MDAVYSFTTFEPTYHSTGRHDKRTASGCHHLTNGRSLCKKRISRVKSPVLLAVFKYSFLGTASKTVRPRTPKRPTYVFKCVI
jgi:hypothetical protein